MEIHVEIAAETLFEIGPIAVTNSMVTMFLVMAAILVVFSLIARRASMVPGRGQGVIELIIEFLLSLVEGTAGKHVGRRIFPLIAGIFIFILFANFSGLLPGVGTVTYSPDEETHAEETVDPAEGEVTDPSAEEVTEAETETEGAEHATGSVAVETGDPEEHAAEEEEHASAIPVLRPPTADLNMTLAMSLLTFIVVQVAGISAHGVAGRIKHMGDPPFIFPIEVISEFSRIVSLAARLFGNVFAGEVLLAVMYSLANAIKIAIIPVVFPVVFIGLEVLFGTIQALVFALLTLIYIALATAGHDEHGHIEEGQVDETVESSSSNRNASAPASGD